MKKAQGLSLNTIVIAALALLVLVVLVLIFTGRIGKFGQGVDETNKCQTFCESINRVMGTMVYPVGSESTCTSDGNKGVVAPGISGGEENTICCCIPSTP